MNGVEDAYITATEAEALTSSSQLATLKLQGTFGQLGPQLYASVFPLDLQLLDLTELQAGAGILHHMASVSQSCPNLQKVCLDFSIRSAEAELDIGQVAAGWEAMSGFGRLQELELGGQGYIASMHFPSSVWQALGSLSQLTSFAVWCMSEGPVAACSDDVMCLTRCTALRSLRLATLGGFDITIHSKVRMLANYSAQKVEVLGRCILLLSST
jgi:hypothetical protein